MTSHDVRDMLDLPSEASRPAKKVKVAAPRPVLKGLAREVQNLGGDNPIAIVPEVSVFKKKRFANRKPAAKWDSRPFKNTARTDLSLNLRHWRRKEEGAPADEGEKELEDSTFAKYNVQITVPRYEEAQYKEKLMDPDWTKDETDYLMDVVEDFDLRWPVIWDRYEYTPKLPAADGSDLVAMVTIPKERSVEDLKKRYYSVAAAMMEVNTPLDRMKDAEFQLHELMVHFNPQQEMQRKKYAEALLNRSKEEAREEESLLLELKRIVARTEQLGEERKELYSRLEAPPSIANIGVYTSSQGLQQLLQQLMSVDKSKKRKSLMGPEGNSPAGPAGANLQSNFDRRDSSVRESISGPSGAPNNKKGPSQGPSERRQLTEEEERVYGVSRHDRLTTSGPAFRHEKIAKPLTSKSSTQQTKMINILNEVQIPQRLQMPTAAVGELYESLLQAINTLDGLKKLETKLDDEIKVLKEKKLQQQRERGELPPEGEGEGEAPADAAMDIGEVKVEDAAAEKPSVAEVHVHKRSASVLSAVSDKSAKRQKK